MTSPCKDCPDRWLDANTGKRCHDSCKKYQAFRRWRAEVNKRAAEYSDTNHWFKQKNERHKRKSRR